jgi:tRNA(fMet)-specific endonuclease VapC
MILLDTDHITLLQRGSAAGQNIRNRLKLLGLSASPPTTVISYEEQIRGWMKELAGARSVVEEVEVYRRLKAHLAFFSTLEVLEFDAHAATEFQRLRSQKIRIGTMDLKIAAIALAHHATVWTRNAVDFRKVPGLRIEDASV